MNNRPNKTYQSWGRYPQAQHQKIVSITGSGAFPFGEYEQPILAYGQGRSYGDTCLNDGGILIDTAGLSRILAFDQEQGTLRCEAGTTLSTILDLIVPNGWFLPVVPGTKHVTVGGAIAHDIHGKNHHRAGTFGCHVIQFELMRSTGERLLCSRTQNAELYRATIAGMGLTGLILWAEVQLQRITEPFVMFERIPFQSLAGCLSVAEASDCDWDYTVAWLDTSRHDKTFGRGIFTRGNFTTGQVGRRNIKASRPIRWWIAAPNFFLNQLSIRSVNRLYYSLQSLQTKKGWMDYQGFLFPLDALLNWNRIYGRQGFFQYQCVVPDSEQEAIEEIIARTLRARSPATLAVLKLFGDKVSPGMMSFPRRGITLSLDFPNRGKATLSLLDSLDEVTLQAKGAVYPAKDARMSSQAFQTYFPKWKEFSRFIDPQFSSTFWRRVTANATTYGE